MSPLSTQGYEMRRSHITMLLRLGESIYRLYQKDSPSPFREEQIDESEESLRSKVDEQTRELQALIPNKSDFIPLRKALGCSVGEPVPSEPLHIVALVAYHAETDVRSTQSMASISLHAGPVFSPGDRLKGMHYARLVIGKLIAMGTLLLDGSDIKLFGMMRLWLACSNPYAQSGLTERDADFLNRNRSKPNETNKESITYLVRNVPFLTPQQIFDEIGRHGYIGQAPARRAISLAAYRHVMRLRMIHLDNVEPPPRENGLLIGPTGCGKSFLIKTLFQKILTLPTTIIDVTTISECGYVGDDVQILLQNLYMEAKQNIRWAEAGVGAIDEVDKIAASTGTESVFGGSRREVSKSGVQRGLLKILEEDSVVDIGADSGMPINRSRRLKFRTSSNLFLAMGAFSGIQEFGAQKPSIGFGGSESSALSDSPGSPDGNITSALVRYGISRELLGRLGHVIQFRALSADTMLDILEKTTIQRYAAELALSGISLNIDDDVKLLIVQKALERNTGARGLSSELLTCLNDACFLAYSNGDRAKSIRLFREGGSVMWDVQLRKRVRKKHNLKSA